MKPRGAVIPPGALPTLTTAEASEAGSCLHHLPLPGSGGWREEEERVCKLCETTGPAHSGDSRPGRRAGGLKAQAWTRLPGKQDAAGQEQKGLEENG